MSWIISSSVESVLDIELGGGDPRLAGGHPGHRAGRQPGGRVLDHRLRGGVRLGDLARRWPGPPPQVPAPQMAALNIEPVDGPGPRRRYRPRRWPPWASSRSAARSPAPDPPAPPVATLGTVPVGSPGPAPDPPAPPVATLSIEPVDGPGPRRRYRPRR
ncbi:hypothetical protein D3C85_113640 [compost metagenome]